MPNSQDEKQIQMLSQRILAACAVRLGGVAALSKYLGCQEAEVLSWLGGRTFPPTAIVLKAVDPLVDEHRQ